VGLRGFGLVLVALVATGCAMFREGNPATTPGSSYGPCGAWVDCGEDQPKSDRCCPPTTACAVDDGGPYCAASETYDPADPVTWKRARIRRRAAR
jgi:hypothetical protein